MLSIAPLSTVHNDAAVELWQQAGLTRPWNDPVADLHRALAGPNSTVLAGIDKGDLVATAMVGHDGHRGWVYYLAVRPEARRQGHGRAMMSASEAWLAERGLPKLNLMVRDENGDARGFYAALGYRRDEVVVLSRRLAS
jgi:ribosomal protein S18 acetylase RimI-like enzyme